MRIGVTEIHVDDQERAWAFYTDVLGFTVVTDAAYSDRRWLTVVAPGDGQGPELLLSPLTHAARALQDERREARDPALSLTTTDCAVTYRELVRRGVRFVFEPQRREYGGIDAVFEDGCGNLLNLHEG
jgi:catechol 2,3-dioxygenase-like lactoylglutathione lyase family enzyme